MLDVQGLSGGYGDLVAFRDISLTVTPGSVSVVLGRNGAGKTSLLDAIGGLLPTVRSGTITFDGVAITRDSPSVRVRRGIGYVQEGKRVFRKRTVEENLLLGTYTLPGQARGSKPRRDALALAYQRFPMLADKRKESAGGLSGGQQQMLAIAQALAGSPKILMLDEPSAGLAPTVQIEVFDVIASLRDEGIGILLVEQVVDRALAVADTVTVISSGTVTKAGPASDFSDSGMLAELYLGR